MCDWCGFRRGAAFAGLALLALAGPACAQAISVSPEHVRIAPGQKTTILTVVNKGTRETSLQIRAFAWHQKESGEDQISSTDELFAKPLIVTVAPGATQVIRLVLRRSPQAREASYRILLDQLTRPGDSGRVDVAGRLSIPVFAEPFGQGKADVQWWTERRDGRLWLVAANTGARHETFRDMALKTADGASLNIVARSPSHILAGGRQRWLVETKGPVPPEAANMRLTARGGSADVDKPVGP